MSNVSTTEDRTGTTAAGFYHVVESALPPFRHKEGDAGYDMYATEDRWIFPFIPRKVPVNLRAELPEGHFGLLTSRSGESTKGNVAVPGIIDHSYRGQLAAIMFRIGFLPRRMKKGTRVAQLLVIPCREMDWQEKAVLSETDRGATGFGSSGKN